ncbi:MAG: hypothetical protein DHS20C21_00060 [Gemmatimonadota bacterium]|nr:MAG: hypothetical protein DHS20C21_00060 [Gemmatimonadota bacterium]
MKLTRRPAEDADKAFVQDANRAAYEDVVVRQFGQWDEAFHEYHFNKKWEDATFEIVESRSGPVGALWTTDEGDHLWLREVFLLPVFQGQGIGTALIRQELAKARRFKKPLRLRVLRENRALSLYERLGFSVCGETETHFLMEAV